MYAVYSVEVYSVHGDKTTPGWSGKEGRVKPGKTARHPGTRGWMRGLLFTFNYVIPDTIKHRGEGLGVGVRGRMGGCEAVRE